MTDNDRDDGTRDEPTAGGEPGTPVEVEDGGDVEAGAGAPRAPADGDVADMHVAELREELESLNDRHLRLAAEFDNYRKRNLRERETLVTRLQADLVTALLDVLDDLQRVAHDDDAVDAQAVLEGVQLVEKKMLTVLEGAGLNPVDAEGERFDPELMEALGTVATDDPAKDGQVADVFQRGYRLRDMLLRPARVRVYQHDENG